MLGQARGVAFYAMASLALWATPASAETLRITGVYPADSDGAAALNAIMVDKFTGIDGPALSSTVATRLREAQIDGESYFAILVPPFAEDAEAVLKGHAEPRYSETEYTSEREICWTEDDRGRCTERREVELDCLRVTIHLRPQMQLIAANGNELWRSDSEKQRQMSFCPEFDDAPDADPHISAMIGEFALEARHALAPVYRDDDIRIMERRRGLSGNDRNAFRDAIRLTGSNEAAACDEFARLHATNPDHPALSFNVGLCAEQRYDIDAAQAAYRHALQFEDSDDEAEAGLIRLDERMRADMQLANHHGH
ncbi:tetratricopeptide repeat protein [Alteraurantiacibacter aquimixticola]|uniref:Tetratricopeptide repeat protein n=1 Tax=Alteraurantiacibacter aquimixticola TaxID=2489173 RepID=A0A4T3F3V8_9SPHN|nr:hypothetical protein [Alteraurantiacibacter aquimixticola]TIX51975.1 hypothetical protein E5222_05960 [Alteraurantiacibacter aquimixticola]